MFPQRKKDNIFENRTEYIFLPSFTDFKNTNRDSSHGLVEQMILGLQQFNLAF
jgi:hypothetical protein